MTTYDYETMIDAAEGKFDGPDAPWYDDKAYAAAIRELLDRQQEHLALIQKLSQTVPLESEVADALNQRGAMVAEIGTLKATIAERDRTIAALKDARVPTILYCPECGELHLDLDEWTTRPHRTHECQACKHLFRPYEVATVGAHPVMLVHDYADLQRDVAAQRLTIDGVRTALSSRGYCGDGNLAAMVARGLEEAERKGQMSMAPAINELSSALDDASRALPEELVGTVAERITWLATARTVGLQALEQYRAAGKTWIARQQRLMELLDKALTYVRWEGNPNQELATQIEEEIRCTNVLRFRCAKLRHHAPPCSNLVDGDWTEKR